MSGSTARRPKGLDDLDDDDRKAMAEMKAADAAPTDDDSPGGNMPALETPQEPAPEAPEAAETPEAPEAEEAPAAPEKRRDTRVPLAALHEERERRKGLEKANAEATAAHAAELARAQERLNLLAAAVQEAAKPPPATPAAPEPIPDFDADPAGHIRATFKAQQDEIRGLREALGQHGQSFQQMEQQRQQQTAIADLQRWAQQQEAAEMAANPVYAEAQKFLVEGRHAELEAMGYADPAYRTQLIANDAFAMANAARQQGGNFAQRVFALAKSRGFAPKAPEPSPAAPALAAPETPTREAAQERGREMAMSLGSAGGAPRGALTADALARMSDADFAKTLDAAKKDPNAMRALFGS